MHHCTEMAWIIARCGGGGGGDLGEVRSGLREMMQSIKHEVRVFATACHILIDSVWLLLMCD